MLRALTIAVVLLTTTACQRRSAPLATTLVGTWTRTGMDYSETIVYQRDGTMQSSMEWNGVVPWRKGTWHVDGDVLVEEFQLESPVPGQTPTPKEITRTRFVEIQRDKLVYDLPGRPELVRRYDLEQSREHEQNSP